MNFWYDSTVEPATLGLWFWDPPPLTDDGTTIIFMDTEGLYSPTVPANYDAKMFALALIFSSTLIYNELGVLNQQSIDRFQYVTTLLFISLVPLNVFCISLEQIFDSNYIKVLG
jgi:hypothetical protein